MCGKSVVFNDFLLDMGESPSTLAATLSVIAEGGKTFGSRSFSLPFAQGREERRKTRKILSP